MEKIKPFKQTMFACAGADGLINFWTLRYYKKDSIKELISGTGHDWKYYQKNYGYKCIKVQVQILPSHTPPDK